MRILFERILEGNARYVKIAGNSEETPPTAHIATGSQFAVVDAGELKMFDETSGEWNTFAKFDTGASGGGSVGGGLGGTLGGGLGGALGGGSDEPGEPEEPAGGEGE